MDSSESESSLFYFESDQLALKGNADYSALLRTLVILEAQRTQVAKQVDELASQRNYYMNHTDEFLKKIKEGTLETPPAVVIAEIPEINFKKYNDKIPGFPDYQANKPPPDDGQERAPTLDKATPDASKEPWTSEEQGRLEELLLEYPPELVEMRRYDKIAKALGNHTAQQVASRVHKYFQKLHAAGLPVPGRLPKPKRGYNFLRTRKSLINPSTFFPAYKVPVDSTPGSSSSIQGPIKKFKANEEKNRVVEILQAIKKAKRYFSEDVKHDGFTCDFCWESPVTGIRWRCSHSECVKEPVDFCSDCMVEQVIDKNRRHPLHHDFIPFGDYEMHDDFESEEEDFGTEK